MSMEGQRLESQAAFSGQVLPQHSVLADTHQISLSCAELLWTPGPWLRCPGGALPHTHPATDPVTAVG